MQILLFAVISPFCKNATETFFFMKTIKLKHLYP